MVQMLTRYACCNNNAKCSSATRAGLTGTTCLIQRQAVNSCRPVTSGPVTLRQPKRRRSGAQSLQPRAGLLSFFRPTKQSTNKSQAAELVTKILHIASQTNSGATASEEQCKEIKQLAEQLRQAGGVKDPVYSDLTWGHYEIRQTLSPPDTLVNSVSFKTFWIFPGYAKQPATIQTLTGNTYKITVAAAQLLGVQLGPEHAERTFEVLYLDERVRIVQFLPNDPKKSSEPVLFVLRRLDSTTQEHVNGKTNNDMLSEWADSIRGLTSRSKSKAGLATQAERKFSRQNSASR